MTEHPPRLTVGLPVFNGQRYLRAAIESILEQTFTDFELVISDNGSTDETESICLEYARQDPRVRYVRQPENRGPTWNFNQVVELARGELFKWHAADDVCRPTLLQRCVEALDASSYAVCAFPRAEAIGPDDEHLGPAGMSELPTDSTYASKRFRTLINVDHKHHCVLELFGVMRTEAIRHTGGFAYVARGDSVFLVRLALLGRFIEVPEPLFLNRDHPKRSVKSADNWRRRGATPLSRLLGGGPVPPTEWWDASKKGKLVFPEWKLAAEYWISFRREKRLKLSEQVGCLWEWCCFLLAHAPKMARDVVLGAEFLVIRHLTERSSAQPADPPAEPAPATHAGAVETEPGLSSR